MRSWTMSALFCCSKTKISPWTMSSRIVVQRLTYPPKWRAILLWFINRAVRMMIFFRYQWNPPFALLLIPRTWTYNVFPLPPPEILDVIIFRYHQLWWSGHQYTNFVILCWSLSINLLPIFYVNILILWYYLDLSI